MAFYHRWFSPEASKAAPEEATRRPTERQEQGQGQGQDQAQGPAHIIAIASGKGGVGKSTVTANLARALKRRGARVGLLDADIYGPSQPHLLGASLLRVTQATAGTLTPVLSPEGIPVMSMSMLMPPGNDGPVVWRAPMATKAIQQFLQSTQWGDLDYLLVDLPPGTGDVQLTLAQQAQLSGAVIVTTPQDLALGIAAKGLKMFRQVNVPIFGVIENMSGFTCPHCNEETAIFKTGGGRKLAQSEGVSFLGSIPLDPRLLDHSDSGSDLWAHHSKATPIPALLAFEALAESLESTVVSVAGSASAPRPKQVDVLDQNRIEIQWADRKQTLAAPTLRRACGCAHCVDENTGRAILKPETVSDAIKIEGLGSVGRYAITIKFSDGHNTGIYPFEKLAALPTERSLSHEKPLAAQTAPGTSGTAHMPDLKEIQTFLDEKVNPGVASHGGHIRAEGLEEGVVLISMSGGCQGCAASQMTLKQGVEGSLKQAYPMIRGVRDVTDHESGDRPYYKPESSSPSKSAASSAPSASSLSSGP